jgi:hypothetical protein
MPVSISHTVARTYLESCITNNKARGMVAEFALDAFLAGTTARQKVYDGAWLLAPNVANAHQLRHAVFVLPVIFANETELRAAVAAHEADRGFQALAAYLAQNALAVVVSGAITGSSTGAYEWRNHLYDSEKLVACAGHAPFAAWPGNRGRPSQGSAWETDVVARFDQLTAEQVAALVLRQAFYNGYLKQPPLKKPIADPYDVDAFVVGYRGAVLPIELKEKSPTADGNFGLDAGRILMMLRLGLSTDSNGLYLIREVDTTPERAFVNWRYITLSDLILGSSWNLQGGGASMSGGGTQTVMLAGSLFQTFTTGVLSDDWLAGNASLQGAVRERAKEYAAVLQQFLQSK